MNRTMHRLALLAAVLIAGGMSAGRARAADAAAPPVAAAPAPARDSVVTSHAVPAPAAPARPVTTAPATPPVAAAEAAGDSIGAVINQQAVEDIPLQMNSDVLRYIEFFTGAGRSTFERWLKRSGRYMDMFRGVLQKEGLPPDLVHLVFVESGFNLNARSYAAAVGPWQMLQSSARLFGLNVNKWVDERKDPEKATVAAARYLKHLYGIFGDWPLAIASYNAGEGTVLRAIKEQHTTNYWDLKLPKQTQEYVPQFMAALAITRDPVKYGFSDVEFDDPMRFDEVALKGAVDLRAIARLCECSVDDLRQLNPAVRTIAVKGTDGVTTLRVPPGKSAVIQQRLGQGEHLPSVDLTIRHRVQRHETLRTIAAEYSVSPRQLASVNGISRRSPLRAGMLLTVPASLHAPAPEVIDRDADPRASTGYVPPRKIGLPAQITGNSDAAERVKHTVRAGETLYMIATQYKVSVDQVRTWNRLPSDVLHPGQLLNVHGPEDEAKTAAVAAADSAQVAKLAHLHLRPAKKHHAHRGPVSGNHSRRRSKRHKSGDA